MSINESFPFSSDDFDNAFQIISDKTELYPADAQLELFDELMTGFKDEWKEAGITQIFAKTLSTKDSQDLEPITNADSISYKFNTQEYVKPGTNELATTNITISLYTAKHTKMGKIESRCLEFPIAASFAPDSSIGQDGNIWQGLEGFSDEQANLVAGQIEKLLEFKQAGLLSLLSEGTFEIVDPSFASHPDPNRFEGNDN